MGITPSTKVVRRYTDLPALFYLLQHRKITLLDPASWDDTNDSYYLLRYKEKKGLASVLALCLTESEETYHHWRIFSHGSAGVCISFHREHLCAALRLQPGVTVRDVKYRKIRIRGKQISPPAIGDLPFVKRAAFDAEREVRVVYESTAKDAGFLDIRIELPCVLRITLSPWIHPRLKDSVVKAIKSIPDCDNIDVR